MPSGNVAPLRRISPAIKGLELVSLVQLGQEALPQAVTRRAWPTLPSLVRLARAGFEACVHAAPRRATRLDAIAQISPSLSSQPFEPNITVFFSTRLLPESPFELLLWRAR